MVEAQKPQPHVLKVELGEYTDYRLICNLDDAAHCHQVCTVHNEGGCNQIDAGLCVIGPYKNGCIIAEWVNDGGIEAVEFSHIIQLPVTYQWNASHDHPRLIVAIDGTE